MTEILTKGLAATRETRLIEFKEGFDPNSAGEWCELIKDFVAIANSGGGVVIFGVDSQGKPTGTALSALEKIDPADIANKIFKYTNASNIEFEIQSCKKDGNNLIAILISSVSIPVVFEKPGTYDIGGGKQKTAFGVGTIYFRHGAKSEPGSTDDLRKAIERQLDSIRKNWLTNIRKIAKAPANTQFLAVSNKKGSIPKISDVRIVKDPSAIPVRLVRNHLETSGELVHESLSEGIFDEINNVIEANELLARNDPKFVLGEPIYYRIYAERQHVLPNQARNSLLLRAGFLEFYGPFLHWVTMLSDENIADLIAELSLNPRGPQIQSVIRLAPLLGNSFASWLFKKWQSKWKNQTQPPAFYWTLQNMLPIKDSLDPVLLAARLSASGQIEVTDQTYTVANLLDKPDDAHRILAECCMKMFQGETELRGLCRNLDYLIYGKNIVSRSSSISKMVIQLAGKKGVKDVDGEAS